MLELISKRKHSPYVMNMFFHREHRQKKFSRVPTHPVQRNSSNSSLCSCTLLTVVDGSSRAEEIPVLKCLGEAGTQNGCATAMTACSWVESVQVLIGT